MRKKIKSLDLFSGAGGFSLGLHLAGIDVQSAIEYDHFAAQTFQNNFPDSVVYNRDITSFKNDEIKSKFTGIDLLVGGPPCQGFSVAGPYKFGVIDERNHLVKQFIRFVKIIQPPVFIMENVKNIMNGQFTDNKNVIESLYRILGRVHYNIKAVTIYAPNFGVPQSRTRVLIVGANKNFNIQFPHLIETHKKNQWINVEEAISDLPFIESENEIPFNLYTLNYKHSPKTQYLKYVRKGSKGIFNHIPMKHTKRLVERFKHIPQGGSLLDAPPEHGQRLRNGVEIDSKPRFKMNNQRLSPNTIAHCITASFQSTFVHPYLNRNLTAREGARLQSFPDFFIFTGPRTLMSKKLLIRENREHEIGLSQYNQIGNAVPPLVGKAIGKAVIKALLG